MKTMKTTIAAAIAAIAISTAATGATMAITPAEMKIVTAEAQNLDVRNTEAVRIFLKNLRALNIQKIVISGIPVKLENLEEGAFNVELIRMAVASITSGEAFESNGKNAAEISKMSRLVYNLNVKQANTFISVIVNEDSFPTSSMG